MFERWLEKLYAHGLEYFNVYYGVYRGTVMDNKDPEHQGRVRVRVPMVSGNDTIGNWAWPVASWSGKDSGSFCIPDIGDPVYVSFENGKSEHPLWMGGWWPKVKDGVDYAGGLGAYNEKGTPSKRIFKTKAGHELSFEDDSENLSCKLVWHDPAKDAYSFFAFTKDGSLQMANHKGCFIELRATDDDERTIIMDKNGNMITQDKNGTKVIDPSGNMIELTEESLQILSPKAVVINAPSVNVKTGSVEIGDIATDEVIKGTSFLAWWKGIFMVWLKTHIHPTGVGPTGVAVVPPPEIIDDVVLTKKLKVQ